MRTTPTRTSVHGTKPWWQNLEDANPPKVQRENIPERKEVPVSALQHNLGASRFDLYREGALAGFALAGALAFGLGGREAAAQMCTNSFEKGKEQPDQVKADAQTGKDQGPESGRPGQAKGQGENRRQALAAHPGQLPPYRRCAHGTLSLHHTTQPGAALPGAPEHMAANRRHEKENNHIPAAAACGRKGQ